MQLSLLREHPRGLWFLFFVEFWERFSYYGISALLVLYLSSKTGMDFHKGKAELIAGSYLTYLYLTTALGGILADRLIGYQKAVLLGGCVIILGHLCLTVSTFSPLLFFMGLGCISAGTGLFKANVSVMVGFLYQGDREHLRTVGFSIFYAGINIGAGIATFLVGYVGEVYGWHYGFSLAAFGMAVGLITFRFGARYLPENTDNIRPFMRKKLAGLPVTPWMLIILAAFLTAIVFACLIPNPAYSASVIGISSVILCVYLIFLMAKLNWLDRKKIITILVMALFMLFFWSLNNQIMLSLPLFIDNHVDHHFMGMHWQTTSVLGCYTIIILLVNPIFAYCLQRFGRKGSGVESDQKKFGISLILEAVAFMFLGLVTLYFAAKYDISIGWILGFQLFLSLGELFISPVGLSLVTRLSPKNMESTMMGVWWTISAYAGFIGGMIGFITVSPSEGASVESFAHAYFTFGVFALLAGAILFLLLPVLKKII